MLIISKTSSGHPFFLSRFGISIKFRFGKSRFKSLKFFPKVGSHLKVFLKNKISNGNLEREFCRGFMYSGSQNSAKFLGSIVSPRQKIDF